jgi:DNA-binding MurR/RpiR family transcriptional regulator
MQIRELLTSEWVSLTPSEQRIAQVLLNDYPTSGLGTAASLARRARVSGPTVNRLTVKLGFAGFPAFQASLLGELEDRLRSPLAMMGTRQPDVGDSPMRGYLRSVGAALREAETASPQISFDRVARLVTQARRLYLLGGRFSRHAADLLAAHLEQFRPQVIRLGAVSSETFDRLVDFGKLDVLIAFDYRRYQRDVIEFSLQAADRGARLVVFTDRWQSPAVARADVMIVSPVEVQSPYDTIAPAIAQVEALVAQIVAEKGDALRPRIQRIETIRRANDVTVNE